MQSEEHTPEASEDAATARKEIFDYLRNEQRLEEARSKSSGLTSWALVAATGLMIWECLKLRQTAFTPPAIELIQKTLAALWPLYLSIAITLKDKTDKALRFEGYGHLSFRAPILTVAAIGWIFVPWIAYSLSFTVYAPITLIPAAILIGLALALIDRVRLGVTRFPIPRFSSQAKFDTVAGLIGFLVVLALQIKRDGSSIWLIAGELGTDKLQFVLLTVAIYWAILFLLDRHLNSFHSDWSHRIERHLLVGNIGNKEALRQIEQRTLGPRFSSVLDEFWSELHQEQQQFQKNLDTLQTTFEEVKRIPEEYKTERSDRLIKSTSTAISSAKRLSNLHKELRRFEKVAIQRSKGTSSSSVLHAIEATLDKHKREVELSEKLIDRLEELTNQVRSMGIPSHLKREVI